MNDASLGGIQYAKCKRPAILSYLISGKTRHRMQLRLARLAKSVRVNDETMLTIKLTTKRLEEHDLKSVEHFAIFRQSKMSIAAGKI